MLFVKKFNYLSYSLLQKKLIQTTFKTLLLFVLKKSKFKNFFNFQFAERKRWLQQPRRQRLHGLALRGSQRPQVTFSN
jgi:hypothetical protein